MVRVCTLTDLDDCDGSWHPCHDCGGEGWIEEEDWEGMYLDPEVITSPTCRGKGGWPCPDAVDEGGLDTGQKAGA